ncbi:hypothetical protein CPAR01_12395 [Colletotrichum paranaense]|uniref:Uncharacterized protein n=1 Tax=Colletotrichum paranaense TaxID=1914294 RepID=A0ABQ9S6D9_9PEZI|nr:uncharacterized protein CPAR01_12395 [Colletotrichum paranaense]KAK1527837.1 hypothetical protein CPAR01_12395 [Colletotrichum paranaense]
MRTSGTLSSHSRMALAIASGSTWHTMRCASSFRDCYGNSI